MDLNGFHQLSTGLRFGDPSRGSTTIIKEPAEVVPFFSSFFLEEKKIFVNGPTKTRQRKTVGLLNPLPRYGARQRLCQRLLFLLLLPKQTLHLLYL